jgi:cytochrome c556
MPVKILPVLLMLVLAVPASAEDARQHVDMPAHMREHMLGNMRDHLLALQTITRQLAEGRYDEAADVAESRLGMTSLETHGASHMAKFMPQEMSDTGTAMHRAASRFAVAARDAAVDGGLEKAFGALSGVMQQCVACHSAYRVH